MVKQERAVRTRRALVRAGAEVFAREGFVAASLSAISRQAGVSNGALHFHFESKRALAEAVESEALDVVRQVVREAATREVRPLAVLVEATYGLVGRLADDVVVRAGFVLGSDPGRGAMPAPRREWQRWVEETMRRAGREGWLARGVSPEDAAAAVVAATTGFQVLGGEQRTWLSRERVAGFWDLLLPRLTEHARGRTTVGLHTGGVGARTGSAHDVVAAGQRKPART
ncbi:ScbR family autoregulator-binding transcription factor [Streptomyces sp. NPDC053367]|uniref:ScbR family autoregulator-binding transcription factor n=1 Tax=Streptomyces sp. NPDC053367 TaxID=3365700 RepID=UPI0037D506F8